MFFSLLVTLREGLEVALILAIVLSYLARIGRRAYFRPVWLGFALAVGASLLVGGGVAVLALELPEEAMEWVEGSTMLLAVGVLTWMLLWMKRQAATIGRHLRAQVDRAIERDSATALALLAFAAVAREGLETVLFLYAGTFTSASPFLYWLGAGIGIAGALALGYVIYKGSFRLPLRAFFNVTGVTLMVLAGGLLVNALHEFEEAGALATLGPVVWTTEHILARHSTLGEFLHAVFGYTDRPHLVQVLAYVGYLAAALLLFFGWRSQVPARPGRA